MMKKSLSFLLAMAGILCGALAQNRPATIIPNNPRMLFIGVENPVKVTAAGIPFSALSFRSTNGRVEARDGKAYLCPKVPGQADLLVYQGGKLIDVLQFNCRRLPDPMPCVGGRGSGTISANELLLAGGLSVASPSPDPFNGQIDFNSIFLISHYSIASSTRTTSIEISVKGGRFTEEVQRIIRRGLYRKINFDQIEAIGPDGSTYKLPNISFNVVY